MAEVTLELLMAVCEKSLAEARAMRVELRDVRTLALQNLDLTRRVERRVGEVERRIDELKDDVEVMLKAEIGGRLAHMETRLKTYAGDAVDSRLREFGVAADDPRMSPR